VHRQFRPARPAIEDAVVKNDFVTASVLSGNRNFEARVHQNIKSNFLMSPPLVVAFALAGRVDIDLSCEPLGKDKDGEAVISLTSGRLCRRSATPCSPHSSRRFSASCTRISPRRIPSGMKSHRASATSMSGSAVYLHSEPPFFENFLMQPDSIKAITGARALGIFGDSVTTDHISPPVRSKRVHPPESSSRKAVSKRRTSTATAHAAATTAS